MRLKQIINGSDDIVYMTFEDFVGFTTQIAIRKTDAAQLANSLANCVGMMLVKRDEEN